MSPYQKIIAVIFSLSFKVAIVEITKRKQICHQVKRCFKELQECFCCVIGPQHFQDTESFMWVERINGSKINGFFLDIPKKMVVYNPGLLFVDRCRLFFVQSNLKLFNM